MLCNATSQPLVLDTTSQPFDDPEWIFEIKHDGFRAFAVLDGPTAQFVSKQGHRLTAFGARPDTSTEK